MSGGSPLLISHASYLAHRGIGMIDIVVHGMPCSITTPLNKVDFIILVFSTDILRRRHLS